MKKDSTQRLIVVLGSGRSGTSVLTRFLGACGMRLSDDMVGASEQNPEGAFEDKEIFDIQTNIFTNMGSSQLLPMPKDWMHGEWVEDSIRKLRDVIIQRVSENDGLWGFKDPRTTLLLPLWIRVFNKVNVVPLYLMAVRDPRAVAASLNRQYGFSEGGAELFWLFKNIETLYHTGGNIFITQYEDWFDSPETLAHDLLEYTGLRLADGVSIQSILKDLIRSNLNRSVYTDYKIQNQWVKDLYAVLKDCRGASFDRDLLMSKMMQCRFVMNQFSGWPDETQKLLKLQKDVVKKLQNQKRKFKRKDFQNKTKIQKLRKMNEVLSSEIIELRKALKKAERKNSNLKIKLRNILKLKQKEIESINLSKFQIMTSFSYRLGLIITDAFKSPIKNLFKMPFRIISLMLGAIFFRNQ
jgi:hypothetical protein